MPSLGMRLRGEGELVRFPNTHRILEGKPMGAGTQLFMLWSPDGKKEKIHNWGLRSTTLVAPRRDIYHCEV